jgi:hypothetical protein
MSETKPDPVAAAIRAVFLNISIVKLDELISALDEFIPYDGGIYVVEVAGARVPITNVEIYGLIIGVDANGRAAEVGIPDGATWTG